jgi:hypothetical protein
MRLVERDDLPPVRKQVGLGHDAGGHGAPLHHHLEELHLRGGELLRGIGDEEDGLRLVERSQGDQAVCRVEATDPRGVDQAEA